MINMLFSPFVLVFNVCKAQEDELGDLQILYIFMCAHCLTILECVSFSLHFPLQHYSCPLQ